MKIEYLGTGAAEGIPALFCNCAFCRAAREKGTLRTRTQVLIDGELSIDFPPDAFYHSARRGADFSAIRYLLFTHSHQDHLCASDLILRGYKFASEMTSPDLDIFGNEESCRVFCESTRRELRPEIGEHIRLFVVNAFEDVSFGKWRLFPLKARHSSKDPLLFLLEKEGKRVLHLHDTGPLPEEDYQYLGKVGGGPVDVIHFDCTFLFGRADENARHMGLEDDMETFRRLEEIGLADGRTKKVITHFSHNSQPTAEALRRAEEEYGVIAAYDGMTLEI